MEDRNARRTLAKFRCSAHTLDIEVGRHKGFPEKDRIHQRCSLSCIENDEHFLLTCNACNELRDKLLQHHQELFPNFGNLAPREKLMFMMLSAGKCHLVVLGYRCDDPITVRIGSADVVKSCEEKLFGVQIDCKLSFDNHASKLC